MKAKALLAFMTAAIAVLSLNLPTGVLAADNDTIAATFRLRDLVAKKVEIAGEFTDWKTVPLTKNDSGIWSITLQLKPGYYGYKFVVDDSPDWIFDPANSSRKTVNGIENSGISVGGVKSAPESEPQKIPVTFTHTTDAKTVHLAGEFNKWLNNVDGRIGAEDAWKMTGDDAGHWKITVQLLPGKYKFKYVINSGERWEKDKNLPASDDDNSLIEVTTAAPATNTTTFTYTDAQANAVAVAGEFNKWSATANPLTKNDAGVWTTSIALKPGRYQYKFVINGTDWKTDPGNNDTATDANGNINSIKIVQ
jgi:1,4-alpha-glucan branching enzyme